MNLESWWVSQDFSGQKKSDGSSTVFSATWKRPPATASKISLAQSWAQLSQDLDKLLPLLVFNSDNKQEIVEEKDIPPL